jgi:hypothetical protein
MQIQGELVRATVTAKQRFNEAVYFFDGMQANQTNMTVFRHPKGSWATGAVPELRFDAFAVYVSARSSAR